MLFRTAWLPAAVTMVMGLAAASHADDWGTVVAVSSTMGVHDGRVCVGEATRGDIGCPTYAPEVGTDGSISASRFVGDGSGLTGVVASTADRIVSGTTSLLAVSSTGFVNLTQAGTNTGWFDPTRGLVTLGVSATGTISGTTGYFSGNVGFGNAYPSTAIETAGVIHVRDPGTPPDNNYNGALRITRPTSAAQYINMVKHGMFVWSLGMTYNTTNFAIGMGAPTDSSFNNPFFVITTIGRVGIGTTNPNANLEVVGTVSATSFRGDGSALTGVGGIPSGAILAFDLASCPSGWSEYVQARGRFLRGIDNGAGNDPGGTRAPGSTQDDALQNITGTFATGHSYGNVNGTGVFSAPVATSSPIITGSVGGGYITRFTFNAASVARTANETRPKNVAVLYCRKN